MKTLLLAVSLFSRLGSHLKNLLYKRKIKKPKKAPLPVISVGNIVFGGSEKTPLVMNLMSFFLKNGLKPALISRGYKGRWERSGGILSDGKRIYASWRDSGDEPFMAAKNAPAAGVFIGKRRLLSCQKAKDLGFEMAILDDGFQHRRLDRDLDIVLYDPGEKITLRESISSLKRANIILIKKSLENKEKNRIKRFFPACSVFEYSVTNKGFLKLNSKKILPPEAFKDKKVLAFCGIARPERFQVMLKDAGMEIVFFFKFPDHCTYPFSSLKKIASQYYKLKPELVITTEKDAIKIVTYDNYLKSIPLYYLKIDLDIEKEFYLSLENGCL